MYIRITTLLLMTWFCFLNTCKLYLFSVFSSGLVYGMDYNRESNVLFYSDRNSSTLWKVSLNRRHGGQDDRVLLRTGVQAWDLTLDWMDDTIYWSDDR